MSILLDIVVPVFGLVGVGYAAAWLRLFDAAKLRGLTYFAFGFAIPALLLRSMAGVDLDGGIAWPFLLSYFLGAFAAFGVGLAWARLAFGATLRDGAIAGMAGSYSNTVLFGIPLMLTVFGERASLPVFLLVAFHSSLMLPLVTLVLEGGGVRGGWRRVAVRTGQGLLRNPILGGLFAGLALNLLGWPLPVMLDSLLKTLGQAAVPCALFAMGVSLTGYRVGGDLPLTASVLAFKLLLHPLIVWLLGRHVFGLEPLWLEVAVLMAALPAGVNVYVLGETYDAGRRVAASAVLLGSGLAIATISTLLFLFGV